MEPVYFGNRQFNCRAVFRRRVWRSALKTGFGKAAWICRRDLSYCI